jgi:hypothetical protein
VPPWLGGRDPTALGLAATGASPWWLVVPVAAFAVGLAVVRRNRGDTRPVVAMTAVAAVAVAVALVSLSQVRDEPYPYLTYWRAAVATLVLAGLGIALARARMRFRRPVLARVPGLAAGAWLLVGSVLATAAVARLDEPVPGGRLVAPLIAAVRAQGPPPSRVLLRMADPGLGIGLFDTVLDELDRRPADVRVDRSLGYIVGPWRTAPPDSSDELWYVSENGALTALLAALPAARVVARSSPLDATDEARLGQLELGLAAQLRAAGQPQLVPALDGPLADLVLGGVPGIDQLALAQVAALNRRRGGVPRLGIVAFPSASPPDTWWTSP